MSASLADISSELNAAIAAIPAINTHCHQLPDREYQQFGLDALLRNSYINWCGVTWEANRASREHLFQQVCTRSVYVWLQKGLQSLYGVNQALDAESWPEWDQRLRSAHQDPAWSRFALEWRCHYSRLVLDAYWDPGSDNGWPRLAAPSFRVNAFFFGYSTQSIDADGNNPYRLYSRPLITDLDEYLGLVHQIIVEKKAAGCVALKVPLAYDRGLDFVETPAIEARNAFARLVAFSPKMSNDLGDEHPTIPSNAPSGLAANPLPEGADAQDVKRFQDYLFFEICQMAAELGLPVQIHTGAGQGLRTNALNLLPAIQANPETRFVLLHGSYPWTQDASLLASFHANVFPDLSILPLIAPTACKAFLHDLLEGSNPGKITWGCDTWTPEESCGSRLALNQVLAGTLAEKVTAGYFTLEDAYRLVEQILVGNARVLYGI
jgi:hypothetical protein